MVERQRAFHSDDYGYIGNLFLRGFIPEGLLWWDWVFYLQKHKLNVLLRVEGVLPFTLISFSSSTFCPLVVLQVFPWSSWTSSRSCCCCHLHYFLLLLTAGGVVLHLGVLTPWIICFSRWSRGPLFLLRESPFISALSPSPHFLFLFYSERNVGKVD